MTRIYRNLVLIVLSAGAFWSCASNPDAFGPMTLERVARWYPTAEPSLKYYEMIRYPDYNPFLALMALYLLVLILAVWSHAGHNGPRGGLSSVRPYHP